MTTAFWNSWQLWEKLCFVLACAIIVTIFAGCFKLIQNHRKLRKHTALAEKVKEEQRMQQVVHAREGRPADVPFGVRAIESGIEVDGVWISRSNTPASSNPPSPATSATDDPSPEKAHRNEIGSPKAVPTLVMPQPMHPYQGQPGNRSRSNSRSPEIQAAAGGSPDRLHNLPNTSEDSIKIRIRPTYQPRQSSHLRFSSGDTLDIGSPYDQGLKEQAAMGLSPIDQRRTNRFSRSSLDSSSTQDHDMPQRPDHISTFFSVSYPANQRSFDDLPYTGRVAGDVDPLANHRQPRVVDFGPLLPRNRFSSRNSADWSSVYSQPSERALPNEQESPRKMPVTLQSHIPAAPAEHEELPSFQSFLEAHPLNAKKQSVPLLDNAGQLETGETHQPLHSTDANRQLRLPSVGRKVNSGFEILPAGTFRTRRQSSDLPDTRPVYEGGSKNAATKLHKKNRSDSMAGRNSTFTETAGKIVYVNN